MLSEYIFTLYNIEITLMYLDSHYIYNIKMNNSQPRLFDYYIYYKIKI